MARDGVGRAYVSGGELNRDVVHEVKGSEKQSWL